MSFRKLTWIVSSVLLLLLFSCRSKTETSSLKAIPPLQEQLRKDSLALVDLQKKYQIPLRNEFRQCDSMLQYLPEEQVGECFDILDLAQAYLSQFDEMLPIMHNSLSYTQQQLVNLQNDVRTGYLSDSLASSYLIDEQAVADTLHQRILYFQDRLAKQDRELDILKEHMLNSIQQ